MPACHPPLLPTALAVLAAAACRPHRRGPADTGSRPIRRPDHHRRPVALHGVHHSGRRPRQGHPLRQRRRGAGRDHGVLPFHGGADPGAAGAGRRWPARILRGSFRDDDGPRRKTLRFRPAEGDRVRFHRCARQFLDAPGADEQVGVQSRRPAGDSRPVRRDPQGARRRGRGHRPQCRQ